MQNKGIVRTLAVLLFLVCAFYLSFSFVIRHYDKQAKEYAAGDQAKVSTLKYCKYLLITKVRYFSKCLFNSTYSILI